MEHRPAAPWGGRLLLVPMPLQMRNSASLQRLSCRQRTRLAGLGHRRAGHHFEEHANSCLVRESPGLGPRPEVHQVRATVAVGAPEARDRHRGTWERRQRARPRALVSASASREPHLDQPGVRPQVINVPMQEFLSPPVVRDAARQPAGAAGTPYVGVPASGKIEGAESPDSNIPWLWQSEKEDVQPWAIRCRRHPCAVARRARRSRR